MSDRQLRLAHQFLIGFGPAGASAQAKEAGQCRFRQSQSVSPCRPSGEDAKLDVALDESFPTSDAPANTAPGAGEPAPSSGYDEQVERKLAAESAEKKELAAGDPGDAPSDSPTLTQA